MNEDSHPDRVDLESYCAALVDDDTGYRIRCHLQYCAECRDKVDEIVRRNLPIEVQ